ncbi:DNA-directed RNA polymerase subunit beta [Paenibacillus sp. FSL H8-0537]|uniref:DNA-directed RNA polymerase subunit beta n=1 Tax=Paenibacillus sp. FSL H8-0537 TaxID=2921399 RepID=UPI003100DD70
MSTTNERADFADDKLEDEQSEQIRSSSRRKGQGSTPEKKKRPLVLRIILWILRRSIVPCIMVIMLIAGLYIGYTVLGKQSGDDVFEWSTWQHVYDLVFSDS